MSERLCIWKQCWPSLSFSGQCDKGALIDYALVSGFNFCPYCGGKIELQGRSVETAEAATLPSGIDENDPTPPPAPIWTCLGCKWVGPSRELVECKDPAQGYSRMECPKCQGTRLKLEPYTKAAPTEDALPSMPPDLQ